MARGNAHRADPVLRTPTSTWAPTARSSSTAPPTSPQTPAAPHDHSNSNKGAAPHCPYCPGFSAGVALAQSVCRSRSRSQLPLRRFARRLRRTLGAPRSASRNRAPLLLLLIAGERARRRDSRRRRVRFVARKSRWPGKQELPRVAAIAIGSRRSEDRMVTPSFGTAPSRRAFARGRIAHSWLPKNGRHLTRNTTCPAIDACARRPVVPACR